MTNTIPDYDKSSYPSDHDETEQALSNIKQKNIEPKETLLKSGMVFGGQYCLVRIAGLGKMGEVWKAYDRIGERDVALKFVPHNIDNYESEIQKAKKCFQDVYALNHQYLCPIHAIVEDKDFGYCLVMKWMPGTLEEYLKETKEAGKPLDFKKTLLILNHLAQALDYIHEKNVIHRDVKTKNVSVTRNEKGELIAASLIDFGLANSLEVYSHEFVPGSGKISGTPAYMPPEQWVNAPQSAQTDQYALAIIAYKLISGHIPFSNSNVKKLRLSILNDPPKLIPGIPRYVNAALRKALSKKPEDRFTTCRQFVYELSGKRQKKKILFSFLICLGISLLFLPIIYLKFHPKKTVQIPYEEILPVYKSVLTQNSEKEYAYIFQEIKKSSALPNSAEDLINPQNQKQDLEAPRNSESSGEKLQKLSSGKNSKDLSQTPGSSDNEKNDNKKGSVDKTPNLQPNAPVSLSDSAVKKSSAPLMVKNKTENKARQLTNTVKTSRSLESDKEAPKKLSAFLMFGSERFTVFDSREGEGWSYSYDKANSRGLLVLNEYNGASFGVSGIDLSVIVKDGTENKIKANSEHGAIYQLDGKLEITGSDKGTGKLFLSSENLTLPTKEKSSAVLYSQRDLSIKNLESVFVAGTGRSLGIMVGNGECKLNKVHVLQINMEEGNDSIHVDGDLSFFCNADDIILLQGGLWHRGHLSLQPAGTDLSNLMLPLNPQTGKLQMKFEILGQKINYFLRTPEDFVKAFNAPEKEACCAIAANIDFDFNSAHENNLKTNNKENQKENVQSNQKENEKTINLGRSDLKNENTAETTSNLLTLNRQKSYTFLSTGNWTVKRITREKTTREFLRIYGELILGSPLGLGSSSLTIDGGGIRTIIPDSPMSGDVVCQSFDNKKYVFRKFEASNCSKCSLIVVHGILKMYHGISIQNNINTNFF